MLAHLLFATALALPAQRLPVHHAAQPVVVSRKAPQNVEGVALNMFAYCDAKGQPTIVVTNTALAAYVVEWTLTAMKPGYPPDVWSSVSRVEPGQFEGWMSPAPFLHLDIRYEDEGLTTTDSIDAFCPATASLVIGLEEWSADSTAPSGRIGFDARAE